METRNVYAGAAALVAIAAMAVPLVLIMGDGGEGFQDTSGVVFVGDRPVADFYLDSCSGCHGASREGGTGPALVPERLTETPEFYAQTIHDGRPGTVMPPWGTALTNAEIDSLVAYILSEPEEGSLEWTIEDMVASLSVITPEEELATEPTHGGDLDDLLLVTERESRAIAVIDGPTHELLGTIPASYRAHGYTFSPTNPRWAYNMGRDGWVFKIDLYTLLPVRQIRIGIDSRSLAISDDGRYLIAGNYVPGTLAILDAETLEPLKLFNTDGTNPEGEPVIARVATILDVSPDLVGPYFLVAMKESGEVWRIDWSDPAFPVEIVSDVGHVLHDGFLSPDNSTFYIASQEDNWMAAIDVASLEVIEKISTGDIPHPGSGATWEVDGVVYGATTHAGEGLVSIWNLDTNEVVASIPTAGPGLFIRSHEASPFVWADAMFAAEPHSITVFDKEPPFGVIGVIEDGVRTLHPEFSADGTLVYISDWDGNAVRVYDAVTLELVDEITDIPAPTGIFSTERRSETLGH
ncbi:MAG: c-type cytochrome [Acidimicrobiales bacterium]|nr:c-type cytochrome [Acidimicrobiales bacterium]